MAEGVRWSCLPLGQRLSRSDPSARQLRTAWETPAIAQIAEISVEPDQPSLAKALHGLGQRHLSGVVAGGADSIAAKHYFRMSRCYQPAVVAGQDFSPRHVDRALILAALAITKAKSQNSSLER